MSAIALTAQREIKMPDQQEDSPIRLASEATVSTVQGFHLQSTRNFSTQRLNSATPLSVVKTWSNLSADICDTVLFSSESSVSLVSVEIINLDSKFCWSWPLTNHFAQFLLLLILSALPTLLRNLLTGKTNLQVYLVTCKTKQPCGTCLMFICLSLFEDLNLLMQ